ncbi:hypothetical protein C5748_23615 [Phyllobacterium phragmitis]|uniref:Uncharacterized protein n=1 Tax=Phyllobacterium phragmitis TaxID=2670329 RepID=A0A2S9IKQ1_9HYPH|nr:hypothetical protein [Phyllobacterium phragmitis]PRD41100.1 hypothetical protein C5748_23615 [Phyllobacterium phragmitis]
MQGAGVNVVTTMHRGGYEKYGARMIESFLAHWPQNATLTVYAEDFSIPAIPGRLECFDLHASCPELVRFKEENTESWQRGYVDAHMRKNVAARLQAKYDFKFDGVKFANKVYAYCQHAKRTEARYMVWLDADTVTLKPIAPDFITDLGTGFVLYLGRRFTHSECGFMRFDMSRPNAGKFFEIMQNMYSSGEIYTLNEWHDSFVFDVVRSTASAAGLIDAVSISAEAVSRHPFIHSPLGQYMDHLKGDQRKQRGKSSTRDWGNEVFSRKLMRKLRLIEDA